MAVKSTTHDSAASSDPVLAASDVSVSFGGLHALSGVSLEYRLGTVTGLIGPNGAGKSTLINVLSGMLAPTSGHVELAGTTMRSWSLGAAARAGVCRTFQGSKAFFDLTVLENLSRGDFREEPVAEARSIATQLGLSGCLHTKAGKLPFGELRRLGVGIALAQHPKILLLDEPGAGLSHADLGLVASAIRDARSRGVAVVLVDHNMRFLMDVVERVDVLVGGRLIAQGDPGEVQNDPQVRAAYLGVPQDA